MSEEEIKKQYANGIVNADEVIKSLIDKFKTDKTSVDIQQLQLIAEYLLYKVDKLQKENKKYIDIFNSTEKIMNRQERTKDKLLKENVELQKENEDMREELQMYVDTPISKLKEENKVLRGKNKYLQERLEFRVNYCNELEHELYEEGNFIHKDIIRKFIKEELPDDEIMKSCENFDSNGVYLRKKLEELLGE